jgi:hypothetical protein
VKEVAPKNPPVSGETGRPSNTQIILWILQGASICALAGALAGVRARMA